MPFSSPHLKAEAPTAQHQMSKSPSEESIQPGETSDGISGTHINNVAPAAESSVTDQKSQEIPAMSASISGNNPRKTSALPQPAEMTTVLPPTPFQSTAASMPFQSPTQPGTETMEDLGATPPDQYEGQFVDGGRTRKLKPWMLALIITGIVVVLLGVVYGAGRLYWGERFYPNTTLGSTGVGGMTFSEVDELTFTQPNDVIITIIDERVGTTDTLTESEAGVSYDYAPAIEELEKQHSAALWFINMFTNNTSVMPCVETDNETLEGSIAELDCLTVERTEPVNAHLIYGDGVFSIEPEVDGTSLDTDALVEEIKNAINNGVTELNVADLGVYDEPSITSTSTELSEAFVAGQNMLTAEVTFTAGDGEYSETITSAEIAEMLYIAEDGVTVEVNEDAITAWMRVLGEEYDTAGEEKTFTTHDGSTVTVSGGDHGWITDEAAMVGLAIENIKSGVATTQEMIWKQTAKNYGENEWGDSYVEVSIEEQHIWCYVDGELVLESDVVTGIPDGSHDTDKGVWYVKAMYQDYVMTGADENGDGEPDYRTPCDYFILFTNSGIAFHDATWQSAFGGTRYKDGYGSHGCVNMPYSAVAELWNLVTWWTPVIVY